VQTTSPPAALQAPRSTRDPLRLFAAIAVPTGWVLLTIPIVLGIPPEPFVIPTLLIGLVLPAIILTRRDPRARVQDLLASTIRLPRPLWTLLPALLLIPVVSWLVALPLGAAKPLSFALVQGAAVSFASSLVIVNLWEEMAWAGFFQRRAMTRWGYLRGSLVTAAMFAAVHLPLGLAGARTSLTAALQGVAALVVAGVGLRLLIGAFDAWTTGSVLALAVLHAAFNSTTQVLDGHDVIRLTVTLGLGLLAALALVRQQARATGSVVAISTGGDR
jgi:membrane protease YdiL (CAAX protease family)